MTQLLILSEVQEAMRARYKAMLLERFPQLLDLSVTLEALPMAAIVSPAATAEQFGKYQ